VVSIIQPKMDRGNGFSDQTIFASKLNS
jgi:hypothetical protein